MEMLSEDPTYLAGGLGLLALVFLVTLRVTQQGKYLVYCGAALGLALVVLLIERVWVTDNERIEDTVYGLAKAVAASDGERAAEFLAPDCMMEPSADRSNMMVRIVSSQFAGQVTKERLVQELPRYKFDYLRVTRMQAHAGKLSGRGTAEFAVQTMGMRVDPPAGFATPPAGMGWSFGLREVSPQVWKIERITPGRIAFGGR